LSKYGHLYSILFPFLWNILFHSFTLGLCLYLSTN
jgi:hypothetical protein